MSTEANLIESELTIVKSRLIRIDADPDSIQSQFERIQGPALQALLVACRTGARHAVDLKLLLLLDIMLRVIDEPPVVSTLSFATPRFKTLQRLFYGALGSSKFVSATFPTRQAWAYLFCQLTQRLATMTTVVDLAHHQRTTADILPAHIEEFDATPLNALQVARLRPFYLVSKTGQLYNVNLAPMAAVLGNDFTASFHAGLCAIARPKAKDSALSDFGNTFASFIEEMVKGNKLSSATQLHDPDHVQNLIVDFMEFHFLKMTRRNSPIQEGTLPSLQKLWSRYRLTWQKLVSLGVVAPPASAFPEGNPKLLGDNAIAHRRLIAAEDGTSTLITQKLIVSVPLHISENEATELLFKQLKTSFDLLKSWLAHQLEDFYAAGQEEYDIAITFTELPTVAELRKTLSGIRTDEQGIAIAAWYIRKAYGGYIDTSKHETPLYPRKAARDGPPKTAVARKLGLPSIREAITLMAFLASEDGRCSEAALAGCILFDRQGKRINAVETDGGLSLSIVKERAANDGWHNVTFTGRAANFIRQWIVVTTPLRNYMKNNNIAGWRYLFIYTGNPLGAPKYIPRGTNLHNHFRILALSGKEQLGDLADAVSIPRIRSTKGILVFLESMDLAAMARELGNTKDTSLRHYLPDSLWDYFATRWIRIFQNLLIVEATRGTPYMPSALQFNSAAEMDEFLRNHAVEPIIPQVEPDNDTPRALDELMIPASPGLFSTLLSVTSATEKATANGLNIAPQALYWSEFTKRLQTHILSDNFHDRGIKAMMLEASKNINSENFYEVVCA